MDKKSFTLLELVIVLALLAILASYAIARFVDLSCGSLFVAEQTTVNSFRTAVMLYYARYSAWPDWADDNIQATPGPFDLLENPPPNINHNEGNYGDGIHWWWVRYPNQTYPWATTIELKCPHYSDTSGRGVYLIWFYVLTPGRVNRDSCTEPWDKILAPGTVVRCLDSETNHCLRR